MEFGLKNINRAWTVVGLISRLNLYKLGINFFINQNLRKKIQQNM